MEDNKRPRNGIPLIHKQMACIMRAVGAIGKTETNSGQGWNFRGIDNVYNSLHQHMAEAGIYTTSEILDKSREERTTRSGSVLAYTILKIRYTFHAKDASEVSTEVIGEGMDSGDKSSNKAMAVAHKYALLQAFMVPTEEIKDPDVDVHEVLPVAKISEDQVGKVVNMLQATGSDQKRFCHFFKIGSVAELPVTKFDEANSMLESKMTAAK